MAFNPESDILRTSDLRSDSEVKEYVKASLRLATADDPRLEGAYEAALEIVLRRSPTVFEAGSGTQYAVPVSIHNQAVVKLTGYLYDAPESAGGGQWSNAWLNSGAGSLVGHFTQHRAGAI